MPEESASPTASDGSVRPDRRLPTFERDVRRMFGSIADRYDAFNHVATFGQDLLWRPRAVWELSKFHRGPATRLLDLGCGTGGLARQLGVRFPRAEVVAVDFSRPMVARARTALGATRLGPRSRFAVANGVRLPFATGVFDVVASAFVARNFADLPRTLSELHRVLRPGGTLLTLEISEPSSAVVGRLFHAHFDQVVPLIGRAFDREGPYSYLPESLRAFPTPQRLVGLVDGAGFARTRLCPMSFGVVVAYLSEASSGAHARS